MASPNGGVTIVAVPVVTCRKSITERRRQCSIAAAKMHGRPRTNSTFAINLFTGPWAMTRGIGHSQREAQTHPRPPMPSCSEPVTPPRISSRFQRRLPGGRYDLVFRVGLGSDAIAARMLRRSRMTIWRWRHDRSPLPIWVADILADRVQSKIADACAARQDLNFLRQLPPRPPRALSGCCAPYR